MCAILVNIPTLTAISLAFQNPINVSRRKKQHHLKTIWRCWTELLLSFYESVWCGVEEHRKWASPPSLTPPRYIHMAMVMVNQPFIFEKHQDTIKIKIYGMVHLLHILIKRFSRYCYHAQKMKKKK